MTGLVGLVSSVRQHTTKPWRGLESGVSEYACCLKGIHYSSCQPDIARWKHVRPASAVLSNESTARKRLDSLLLFDAFCTCPSPPMMSFCHIKVQSQSQRCDSSYHMTYDYESMNYEYDGSFTLTMRLRIIIVNCESRIIAWTARLERHGQARSTPRQHRRWSRFRYRPQLLDTLSQHGVRWEEKARFLGQNPNAIFRWVELWVTVMFIFDSWVLRLLGLGTARPLMIFDASCLLPFELRVVSQAILVLENVARRATSALVTSKLRELGYVTRAFFINTSIFACPQSRTRLFVVAVHCEKAELWMHPDTWAPTLEAHDAYCVKVLWWATTDGDVVTCFFTFLKVSVLLSKDLWPGKAISKRLLEHVADGKIATFVDRLLPNDHPTVLAHLRRCQQQRPDALDSKVRESLRTGCGWKKCFQKSLKFREIVSKELGKEARFCYLLRCCMQHACGQRERYCPVNIQIHRFT